MSNLQNFVNNDLRIINEQVKNKRVKILGDFYDDVFYIESYQFNKNGLVLILIPEKRQSELDMFELRFHQYCNIEQIPFTSDERVVCIQSFGNFEKGKVYNLDQKCFVQNAKNHLINVNEAQQYFRKSFTGFNTSTPEGKEKNRRFKSLYKIS